jgi:hypothetical protein
VGEYPLGASMIRRIDWPKILFLSLIIAGGCASRREPATRAFYYWKSTFALTDPDRAFLRDLGIKKIYLRFFDVDRDEAGGKPIPVAPVRFLNKPDTGTEIVPAVFITNRTLTLLDEAGVFVLARDIAGETIRIAGDAGIAFRELQLDCDWTESTRDRYFRLISLVREQLPDRHIRISATIRLHQIKYAERTGVPPVDRGMMMFYNTGRMSGDPESNSIYSEKDAARYAWRAWKYPLPLDAALPIYFHTVQIRDGKVVGLLNKTAENDLSGIEGLERAGGRMVRATKPFFFHGSYIMQNDLLKFESVPPSEGIRAARQAAEALLRAPRTVAVFEYDSAYLSCYDEQDLARMFGAFR